MSTTQKLTKKQKKALAFRERKTGKGKDKANVDEENDVPELEVQDDADATVEIDEEKSVVVEQKKKTKEKPHPESAKKESTKKRKREETDETTNEPKKKKDGEGVGSKQRFILFVGNLQYATSLEAIAAHFAVCDPPPTVRLLTPKATGSSKPIVRSKGCAFLEFSHRNALQQALKLHHSTLDGRMINVELTAGGGGKSDARITKLKERNKGLFGQRKEKLEKEQTQDGGQLISTTQRPQRFSATSGMEERLVKRKTWSVGDVMDEKTHRGGKKHSRVRPKKSKEWSSGANSIPVG